MAQITLNSTGVASNGSLVLQSNGTTAAVTVDTSQNVGIGTGSPTAKLDVQNNGDIVVRSYSTNASNQAFVQAVNSAGTFIGLLQYGASKTTYGALGAGKGAVYSTDNVTIMADTSTGIINFATGGSTERARIDSSGNLLVGGGTTAYGVISSTGSIAPAATPSTSWGIDFASSTTPPNYVSFAASATYDLAAGSGIVVIHNNTNGEAAVFITYAGATVKLGGAASVVAGTGGANEIGLAYNGGAGKYRINNGYGTTQFVYITTIRTRTAS
jgi:hypothetical protein